MSDRYEQAPTGFLRYVKLRPFAALREKLKEGYGFSDFRADLMAGVIVAMVAIPLGMALAIASGVAPQYGLYTVMIGGAVIALLGGSRFQVSGPTAAFVVILAPITEKFGVGGLLIAGLMAGIMLVIMGVARMGQLIQFIPYPVTTGFTSGIAVVIATLQLKDFFGLRPEHLPESFLGKVVALFHARGTFSPYEFAVGAVTLALLLLWPRVTKKVPAPLVALSLVTVATAVLRSKFPGFDIATIGSRFSFEINGITGHGIPQMPPQLAFPWSLPGPHGQPLTLSFTLIKELMPAAFAITMLGAIESLLSAVVADGLAQTKHDPDAEVVALGVGNILCPFFGGIAATGAIARTTTNIRYGAASPFAAVIHAIFTLIVVVLLAPWVSYLPMASLAALLMLVAYNMSEYKHFIHILKVGPSSDMLVLLACFGLTVVFDMVVGVSVGVVLASLLFMKEMSEMTSTAALERHEGHPHFHEKLPKDVVLYEIAGPLFFGAVESAVGAIEAVNEEVKSVIFVMDEVPFMDVSALVAFESAVSKLFAHHRKVYLVGVQPAPLALLKKSGTLFGAGHENVVLCDSIHQAVGSG